MFTDKDLTDEESLNEDLLFGMDDEDTVVVTVRQLRNNFRKMQRLRDERHEWEHQASLFQVELERLREVHDEEGL